MIYIDRDYKCHAFGDSTTREVKTDFFDGMCQTFIEGYRYIPAGETWTRSDGVVFSGEMISPWRDYGELDAAQRRYERQLIAEYRAALTDSIPVADLAAAYQEGVNSAYDQ